MYTTILIYVQVVMRVGKGIDLIENNTQPITNVLAKEASFP